MNQPIWNFEQEPWEKTPDETDVNLRAYFDRMDDDKLQHYEDAWTDKEVITWDGNFKDDDGEPELFIACSERDVNVSEYREVLHKVIAYRNRVRGELVAQ